MSSTPAQPGLQHFPVTLFASVMGLGGAALAWRRAADVWNLPVWPFQGFLALAVLAFAVVAGGYAAKWVRHPGAARAELTHPIRMAFVPTITISLLILATGLAGVAPAIARPLWWIGALGHLLATIVILSEWFTREDISPTTITPAWFIPIVGNVVTPLASRSVGNLDVGWFTFGVGIVFWLALLPLLLERLLTHDKPLPPKLLPTMAIFIAPPAIALISWHTLTGSTNGPVLRILYAVAILFVLLLTAQAAILHKLPYGLPFLAYTFPMASAAAAAVLVAGLLPGLVYDLVGIALLAATTVIVLVVLAQTLLAAVRRQICVPD